MRQAVDNLVDGPADVLPAEHLIDSWLVEIDLRVFLNNFFVEGVEDYREVSGYGFKLGYLVGELLALDGENFGVGRCRCMHGSSLDPLGSSVQLRLWKSLCPAMGSIICRQLVSWSAGQLGSVQGSACSVQGSGLSVQCAGLSLSGTG